MIMKQNNIFHIFPLLIIGFCSFLAQQVLANGQRINFYQVLPHSPAISAVIQTPLLPLSTTNNLQQPINTFLMQNKNNINNNAFNDASISVTSKTNIFNDRATILYRPQTSIVVNDGQDKDGDCPVTRPANGYNSFKQYEGLWFKRYRSRVREGEPFFKCAYIDYVPESNNNVFISDNLQNNKTGEWFRQNATTVVWANDPSTWTSTLANGVSFDTHLIYYDGNLGVAVIYSCSKTANGHRGIGNIYTRSPKTPLPKSYVDFLFDVFYQNGIYDVMPLHFVDQDNCQQENMPKPRF